MSDTGSFTVAEVATLTGFARQTIYRAIKDGRLNRWLIRDAEGQARLVPDGVTAIRRGVIRPRIDSQPRPAPAPVPAPVPEPQADEPDEFWSRYGRIAGPDEPPLTEDEVEEHTALIVWHLMEPPDSKRPPTGRFRFWLWDIETWAADAREDVASGVRFDQAKWDTASVQGLLEDLPCDAATEMLRCHRDTGHIPPELLATVTEALGDG